MPCHGNDPDLMVVHQAVGLRVIGYRASFATAEAPASIGGQIMPPILAAVAFIMADFVGIPFRSVALAATIPALLYFYCVFVTVYFEAKKLNLQRLPREELPSVPGSWHGTAICCCPLRLSFISSIRATARRPKG
jgi:TRAP-type uncharacterized transport system fused permease subunit